VVPVPGVLSGCGTGTDGVYIVKVLIVVVMGVRVIIRK